MSKITDRFIEVNNLYNNEGERGLKNLETVVEALGYRKHSFRYGELIEVFLADNPGAVEAIQDWISEQNIPEWNDRVEMELDEEDDPDYDDENEDEE